MNVAFPFSRINLNKHMWHKVQLIFNILFSLLRQNVLLTVRSQYRYWVVSKIFQPSKVPIKIYFILRPYFIQNKYVPHTINWRPTPRRPTLPPVGALHSLRTSLKISRAARFNWIFMAVYYIGYCSTIAKLVHISLLLNSQCLTAGFLNRGSVRCR
jgi:hypothetical protein